MRAHRGSLVLGLFLATALSALNCAAPPSGSPSPQPSPALPGTPSAPPGKEAPDIEHGRRLWYNETFGGEKFFAFLAQHPDPAKRLKVAFEEVVLTERSKRFDVWGTINDPDCRANPAGGADLCPDPEATGVVGIRKFAAAGGAFIYGVSCASCHAGFDPLRPPANPNEPKWENIHPSIGDQYGRFGRVLAANLAADDPRRLMFEAWPDGAVDTTALFNDNIMNPGVVTAFWEQPKRPTFDVGSPGRKVRSGQGGEDDLGNEVAIVRVFTNLGACFKECVAPRPDRPDFMAPIDLDQCRRDCRDLPSEKEIGDISAFMKSIPAPKFPGARPEAAVYSRGLQVFAQSCSSCHRLVGDGAGVLSNDEVNFLAFDPANATNTCRALSSNWEQGHLWQPFSSSVYKARAALGLKGYRTMPLVGSWATSPLLHNQSVGPWAAPVASPEERGRAWEEAMSELLSADRPPKVLKTPVALGPIPAGTPLIPLFSRDPKTGQVLCDDVVENRGHYYGVHLPSEDKAALIAWLKFQ